MGEGAAATAGDELDAKFIAGIPAVVMPIARQHREDLGAVLARQHADLVQVVVVVVQPTRFGEAQNDLVARFGLVGHQVEIVALAVVEVIGELDVGTPNPPIVRKFDRKIAAVLVAAPAAELRTKAAGDAIAGGTEEGAERGEAIVPIVIAGNGEELALRFVGVEGPIIGIAEAVLVFLFCRVGVDLIAAHDEKAAGGEIVSDAFDLQAVLSQHVGHGEGGLEAVAEIGDIIDPYGAGGVWVQSVEWFSGFAVIVADF